MFLFIAISVVRPVLTFEPNLYKSYSSGMLCSSIVWIYPAFESFFLWSLYLKSFGGSKVNKFNYIKVLFSFGVHRDQGLLIILMFFLIFMQLHHWPFFVSNNENLQPLQSLFLVFNQVVVVLMDDVHEPIATNTIASLNMVINKYINILISIKYIINIQLINKFIILSNNLI